MGLFSKKIGGKTAKEWSRGGKGLLDECMLMREEGKAGWRKKAQEAIGCYDKALEIRPDDVSLWYSKALARSILGEYREAIECFDRVLRINPDTENAWFEKGEALHGLRRRREAIDCYDAVIKLGRINSRVGLGDAFRAAWTGKGNALYELGEYYKTIECCDEAPSFLRDDADMSAIKGKALGRPEMGRYEEAIGCYDAALGASDQGDLWCYRGEALLKLEKRSEAIASFKKALELYGGEKLAPGDLLLKGKALLNLRRYGDAISCFKEVVEAYGKSADPFEKRQREEGIEGALHAYVFEHGGEINVKKCAKELKTSESEIKAAIGVLEAEGVLARGY